jgi:probable blue pigment (indigoidine) exporter
VGRPARLARAGRGTAGATLLGTVGPVAWGTTYVTATELLPQNRPLLAAMVRALPLGVLVLVLARPALPAGWYGRTALLGLINIAVFPALIFFSAYRLPGGVASVVISMQPLIVLVLASRLLGQRARPASVAAASVSLVGVVLLVGRSDVRLDALGVAASACGAVAMALGVVLQQRWGRPPPILAFTAWQLALGGAALLPFVLVIEGLPGSLSPANAAGFVYQAVVVSGIAFATWFHAVARLRAAAISLLALLTPVVAASAGWVVRGEALAPLQLVGAALVLGAVVAGQRFATENPPVRGDSPLSAPAPLTQEGGRL